MKLRVKTFKTRTVQFFFLFEDFRLCSRFNNVNYGTRHVYKPWFGFGLLLLADSLVPKFHFQLSKKAREKSRKRSDIVQFGRWRDSFSSALCSILSQSTLFQPMTARVISKLYYKFPKGTRLTSHVCTVEI